MFYKFLRAGLGRKRRENGLLYGSLITAIIAFYTLLSLENQDVIRFLRTLESDALKRLFMIIPVLYLMSLFFVFFLVYFATKQDLRRRYREFGLLQMLGMRRKRLFGILLAEHLGAGLISLALGLPLAILLTEGISLITSHWIGLSLLQHQFSLSASGLIWTVLGFVGVQLVVFLILSASLMRRSPGELMMDETVLLQKLPDPRRSRRKLIFGIVCLLFAYALGVVALPLAEAWSFFVFLAVLLFGSLGVFAVYSGAGNRYSAKAKRAVEAQSGLAVFTYRQVQELLIAESKSLAVASLLLLVAISSLAFGFSSFFTGQKDAGKGPDVSVLSFVKTDPDPQIAPQPITLQDVERYTRSLGAASPFAAVYQMDVSNVKEGARLDFSGFVQALRELPANRVGQTLTNVDSSHLYLIRGSSYDQLLTSLGLPPLQLRADQCAFYTSLAEFLPPAELAEAVKALGPRAVVNVSDTKAGSTQSLQILPHVENRNIVADRSLTLSLALIVPDQLYAKLAADSSPAAINLQLRPDFVKKHGLLQALLDVEPGLDQQQFRYESYLSGIGRQVFYTIGGSYLAIYLGLLFLLIANTVIGIKFLNAQIVNRRRYRSLLMLGAERGQLLASAKRQLRLFFLAVLSLSALNSIFGVISLFKSFGRISPNVPLWQWAIWALALILTLLLVEWIYMHTVERSARREIMDLEVERQL